MDRTATIADWVRFPHIVSTDRIVVAFDHRGIGQSIIQEKKEEIKEKGKKKSFSLSTFFTDDSYLKFTMPQLASDVASLITTLFPHQRVHVMGCSMGGMMVQQLLIDHSHLIATAIIGCSSFGGGEQVLPPSDGDNLIKNMTSATTLSRSDPNALHQHLTHIMSLNVTPKFIETHPIMFASMVDESARQKRPLRIVMAQLAALMTFESKEHLPEIAKKMTSTSTSTSTPPRILIIHGDRDRVIPVENGRLLRDALGTSCEYIEMKEMGHVFWSMDETNEAAHIVRTFLQRHDKIEYNPMKSKL